MIEKLSGLWLMFKKAIGILIIMNILIFLLLASGLIIQWTNYEPLLCSVNTISILTFLYGIVYVFFFNKKEYGLPILIAIILNNCLWFSFFYYGPA